MPGEKTRKGKNKKKSESSPGMKVLAAYWLMLYGGRPYSTKELMGKLSCSKAQVGRIMAQVDGSGYAPLNTWIGERQQKFYELSQNVKKPKFTLNWQEIQNLLLCRDMVWHLLPEDFRKSITKTLGHVSALLPDFEDRGVLMEGMVKPKVKGGIDYSQKGDILDCLVHAIQESCVCTVNYTSTDGKTKTHRIAPQVLESSGESIYVQGRMLKSEKDFDSTLALHRIDSIKLTEDHLPTSEVKKRGHYFGIIDGEPFRVWVAFKPQAARYVSERVWSSDQKLEPQSDGGVVLEFTATSEEEVISMVLSFGVNAVMLAPNNLVDELKIRINKMYDQYSTI